MVQILVGAFAARGAVDAGTAPFWRYRLQRPMRQFTAISQLIAAR